MAANAQDDFKDLLATPELPDLGPGPRPGVKAEKHLDRILTDRFRSANLSPAQQNLIRALILLWHDHLDVAHRIAQDIDNVDGALVHGIMHRREPDYGNAKYWFRRVGNHECFPNIASCVAALPDSATLQLLHKGNWDPFAFVDACEHAARKGTEPQVRLLRQIQQIETDQLLEHFLRNYTS